MNISRLLTIIALFIAIGMASLPSYAASINDLRLWRAPDHTRLVFELSEPIEHNVITLQAPHRVVLDLPGTQLKTALSGAAIPANSSLVKLRSGKQKNNDLRIVLDLNAAVKPRSQLLPPNNQYGHRLVIDLFDAKANQNQQITKTFQDKKRDVVIVIDAGHGGEDPGAIGPQRQREKVVVLQIAQRLLKLINKEPGYKAVLTRSGDYFVHLSKRRELARKAQADLLLSIHADAFTDRRAHGASVYALSTSGASSATARFLAKRANNSDLVGGVSLKEKDDVLAGVLADLSMTASMDLSLKVGAKVLKQMGGMTDLHSRKVGQANFAVLRSPDIPSILVETGFISNPTEAKKLVSSGYQLQLSKAIFAGVKAFFNHSPPPGTYLAYQQQVQDKEMFYTVVSGDSLSTIAQRYQVSVNAILKRNKLKSSVIRVGQKLVIPAG